MLSLIESDVLDIEEQTRFQEFCPKLVVGKRKTRASLPAVCNMDTTFSHPVAPLPIQEDGDIRKIGFRA